MAAAAALITILLLSLLFIASLLNIILTFYPTKRTKLYGWLQSFSPSHKNSSFTSKEAFLAKKTTGKIAGGGNSGGGGVAYCKKVFATFDKDGDGFITRRELRESFKGMRIAMTDEELEELVAKSDHNRDGFIDFGEFCKLLEEANMVGPGEGAEEEEEEMGLKEAFDVFDKDKDGLISVEELGMVLSSMGLISEVEKCMEMISKVDMDGDGMVNFDEFKKMMMVSK